MKSFQKRTEINYMYSKLLHLEVKFKNTGRRLPLSSDFVASPAAVRPVQERVGRSPRGQPHEMRSGYLGNSWMCAKKYKKVVHFQKIFRRVAPIVKDPKNERIRLASRSFLKRPIEKIRLQKKVGTN